MPIEFIEITEKIADEHPVTDHQAVKLTLEFKDKKDEGCWWWDVVLLFLKGV